MKSIRKIIWLVIDAIFPKDRRHERAVAGIHKLSVLAKFRETKQGVIYLFDYSVPLIQDMVVTLKTWGDNLLAREVARILNEILLEEFTEMKTFSSTPIVVTCIPISKTKRNERGFNQCELIIDEVEKQSSDTVITFDKDCLKVFRETDDQVGKSKSERLQNLKGAFVADEKLVRDRNIFVIDDVTTTGATLLEARRALLDAGASKVVMISLAH